ncbi:hypothetical protein GCM10009836_40860 [Pseudonocardia ailaonensis]|uniref:YncI copper-binding domain-containing protein n=1 Tax=Pseudonocardia ailaonensis TaxID=367279 RepID=A0ABN2N953_9PSEU
MRLCRTLVTGLSLLSVVTVLLVGLAGAAAADVVLSPDHTEAGATDVTVTFRLKADDPGDPVVSLRAELPSARPLQQVRVPAPAGWQVATTPGPSGELGTVEWTASEGSAAGADPVDLVLQVGRMPDGAGPVRFRLLQTTRSGATTAWTDIEPAGQAPPAHGDLLLPFGAPVAAAPPVAGHDHDSGARNVTLMAPAGAAGITATVVAALLLAGLVAWVVWALGRWQRERFSKLHR